MLSREKRLNLKKDFKWVVSGKKLETAYLKIFVKFAEGMGPRIGIATSGKVFKKATKRNLARRLTSWAFEQLYFDLPQNANILALPKAGIVNVKSNDVLSDLIEGLDKIGVIRKT